MTARLSSVARSMRACGIALIASTALSGCMTLDQDREVQRPALPQNHAVAWTPSNRLYRSVVLDYVTGMNQHSYIFGGNNQSAFRPLLEHALEETGMLAPPSAPLAARYALQVEFKELEGTMVGTDFVANSVAVYRLVDRSTGRAVFQTEIPAAFKTHFPGLNETDAARAYVLSRSALEPVGAAIEAGIDDAGGLPPSERGAYWRGVYYASAAAVLFGPVVVGLDFIRPTNFVASPNFLGAPPHEPVLGARRGVLSTEGIGSRNGRERARQTDAMMMSQSLTKFVIALADSEHVQFTTLLPCVDNVEVAQIKRELEERGMLWQTDDCMAYQRAGAPGGVTYTSYR